MVVRENDILISKTAPNRGAICFIDKHFDGYIASTGFAVIREVKDIIDRRYLLYALKLDSTLKQLEQRSTGTLYLAITKTELQKILIPLPSKEIQIRIIALMDSAYALRKQKLAEAAQIFEKAKQEIEAQLLEIESLD